MSGYDSVAELFMELGRLKQRLDWLEAANPAKPKQKSAPENSALETSGNVVCLPGVTLGTVRRSRRQSRKPDGRARP